MTILDVMERDDLLGRYFKGESWEPWKSFLCALFCLPMTESRLAIYQRQTQRIAPPLFPPREAWVCCGRRGGKSIIAALISFYLSVFVDHSRWLAPGEQPSAMTISPDRKQSRVIGRFQRGFIRAIPELSSMVVSDAHDSLELASGAILETMTANLTAVRGYTALFICNDECCFLPTDNSVEPDVELLHAERPCLVSLPDSLLLSISSPHARRGVMWDAFQQHFGKEGDSVLYWKATSLEMIPLLDHRVISEMYEADPAIADAEWGGNFRSDCERLFTTEMLDAATDYDRPEILEPCFEDD